MKRLFLLFCGLLAGTPDVLASMVSLTSINDAFVSGGSADPSSGSSTANYGGAGALQVSASGSIKGEMQSLLKFDLASAKTAFDAEFGAGNWLIQSITLQLGTNFGAPGAQPNNPIFNSISAGAFAIDWLANDNWGEGTGTPAAPFIPSNPPVDGVTFASLGVLTSPADRSLGIFTYTPIGNTNPPGTPPATYALSLDASFLADAVAGNQVSFRAYAADTGVSYLFNSRSFGTAVNRPTLIVNAVPEPGTGMLAAITGMTVYSIRRRRHAETT